jgi:hypothetical protein
MIVSTGFAQSYDEYIGWSRSVYRYIVLEGLTTNIIAESAFVMRSTFSLSF